MIQPKKILSCYGVWQNGFEDEEIESNIEFHKGIPVEEVIEHFVNGERWVIVLDDLMDQVVKNEQIQHLFTRTSHHRKVDVVYINQNMFAQGKHARTVNLNSHYLILLKRYESNKYSR